MAPLPTATPFGSSDPSRGPGGAVGAAATQDLRHRLADDPHALAESYQLHGPMVLAYLRRFVGRDDAEDVLQQVFLEVWRSRARYDPARPLEPWIVNIAHKRAIDHLRRRSRHDGTQIVSLTEPDRAATDRFVDEFAEAQVVTRALGELSVEQRETLVLAYFNDLTQSQIAGRMNVPLGTVKARSQRGLRRLAAILVPEEES
jgi:RNA polymerase sigma-70 factor (ECF subfamily)